MSIAQRRPSALDHQGDPDQQSDDRHHGHDRQTVADQMWYETDSRGGDDRSDRDEQDPSASGAEPHPVRCSDEERADAQVRRLERRERPQRDHLDRDPPDQHQPDHQCEVVRCRRPGPGGPGQHGQGDCDDRGKRHPGKHRAVERQAIVDAFTEVDAACHQRHSTSPGGERVEPCDTGQP
jgi:hypothetical protein